MSVDGFLTVVSQYSNLGPIAFDQTQFLCIYILAITGSASFMQQWYRISTSSRHIFNALNSNERFASFTILY